MSTNAGHVTTVFRRVLELVRRASQRIYALLVIALLAVVYVTVLPWFALIRRLRRAPRGGWQLRTDHDVASVERLRAPF